MIIIAVYRILVVVYDILTGRLQRWEVGNAPFGNRTTSSRSPARDLARPRSTLSADKNTAKRCWPCIVMNAGRLLLNFDGGKPHSSKSYRRAKQRKKNNVCHVTVVVVDRMIYVCLRVFFPVKRIPNVHSVDSL